MGTTTYLRDGTVWTPPKAGAAPGVIRTLVQDAPLAPEPWVSPIGSRDRGSPVDSGIGGTWWGGETWWPAQQAPVEERQGAAAPGGSLVGPILQQPWNNEAVAATTLEGMMSNLEQWANLRNTAVKGAGASASGAYGGAIAAVNSQIEEAKDRMAQDTGIINDLIRGAKEIYQGVVQNARKHGAAAAAAIAENTEKGEKTLAKEHRGAEGKVRAIMDLVGAAGEEAVFMELTRDLDETMAFIEEGFGRSVDGVEAMTATAQRMAVTAAKAAQHVVGSEQGMNLDTTITRFNGILENLFKRRASLYAARAAAIANAQKEAYQKFGQEAPSNADEFASRALAHYIENSEHIPRQMQQEIAEVMSAMDYTGLSLHEWISYGATEVARTSGTAAAAQWKAETVVSLQPYYDVIQAGSTVVQAAYKSWEDTVSSPYDTDLSWWEQFAIKSEMGNAGGASPAERYAIASNPEYSISELVNSIPTAPSVPRQGLASLGIGG